MTHKLIPAGYRILVDPDEVKKETESGIVLVTDEKLERAANQKGTVVGLGEFAYDGYKGKWVKLGDRIIYSQYAGKFLEDPNEEGHLFVVLNDEDVVAIIKEES